LVSSVRVEKAWAEIEANAGEVSDLCSGLVKCPTENPPGDTGAAVDFLEKLFRREGISYKVFEPKPGVKSLVAQAEGSEPGPVLVMNGHIDEFPADDASLWSDPPFSGLVKDGRLYGRGASDMKAGVTASLYAFLLFHRLRPKSKGKLLLMLVGDEESAGQWGTDWILDHYPDLKGDACLIGEPTGLGGLRVGEKGPVWVRLDAEAKSYHAAVADGAGPIREIAEAIRVINETILRIPGETPPPMKGPIEQTRAYPWFEQYVGRGWILDHVSVNFGMIDGGLKVNIVPPRCSLEVDLRVPLGITPDFIIKETQRRLSESGLKVKVSRMMHRDFPANFTAPEHPLIVSARKTATQVVGKEPILMFSPTFTDARLFRLRGVPTILFGVSPYNMAGPDEYILVSELLAATKVHTGIAFSYLVDGLPAG
jgi:succinyl-diaminopimelate desuccinylase